MIALKESGDLHGSCLEFETVPIGRLNAGHAKSNVKNAAKSSETPTFPLLAPPHT